MAEDDGLETFEDPTVREAWRVEIERRAREILEGRVKTIPHEQVMSEARERMKRRRGGGDQANNHAGTER